MGFWRPTSTDVSSAGPVGAERSLRRTIRAFAPVAFCAAGLFLSVQACKDTCAGVACGPAPPLIEVGLLDTVSVDTTITVTTTDPDTVREVDTTLVLLRSITDATVSVARLAGADTVVFDMLLLRNGKFYKDDQSGMPSDTFAIVARRGGRVVVQRGLTIQRVDGCCAYPVVGYFNLQLPQ